jgi:hypothetical protein
VSGQHPGAQGHHRSIVSREVKMRSIAIIGLILFVSCQAFGQTTGRLQSQPPDLDSDRLPLYPMQHHQPTQAEVEERESEQLAVGDRAGAARPAKVSNEQIQTRFLTACMARLNLDEPLGSEQKHRRFCTCRIDALKASITSEELEAVALNIEDRNEGKPFTDRLPAKAYHFNETAIDACMNELAP